MQKSDTHEKMLKILEENNFVTQEFILSPMQFGLPYSRPRYFCLVSLFSLKVDLLLFSWYNQLSPFYQLFYSELPGMFVLCMKISGFLNQGV